MNVETVRVSSWIAFFVILCLYLYVRSKRTRKK
jgi:hypothetical protein